MGKKRTKEAVRVPKPEKVVYKYPEKKGLEGLLGYPLTPSSEPPPKCCPICRGQLVATIVGEVWYSREGRLWLQAGIQVDRVEVTCENGHTLDEKTAYAASADLRIQLRDF